MTAPLEGKKIRYTNGGGTTIAAGTTVVQGTLIGVAEKAIAAAAEGNLFVQGVHDLPKATGAGTDLTVGTKVYWDAVNSVVTSDDNDGANVLVGQVTVAALTTDATVRVRLSN